MSSRRSPFAMTTRSTTAFLLATIRSPEIGRHVCRPSSRLHGLVDLKAQGVGVDEDQDVVGVLVEGEHVRRPVAGLRLPGS